MLGLDKGVYAGKITASFTQKIEVEVENSDSAIQAAELGVDIIMFDNMPPDEIGKAIKILKEKNLRDAVFLEASGNISLENIAKYSKTGVDVISVGALTHSSNWLDLSLRIVSKD